MHWNEIFNLLRCQVERVLEADSGFTNPFSSSFEEYELYFLSFGVPAKPGIAKDVIEADLSIGHNVDLELTLPFLLGPIPWSLSTPDRNSIKTDTSKLPHDLYDFQ